MIKSKNVKNKRDHFYSNSILVNKFVNLLTDNGKKKSYRYKLLLKSLSISKYKILLKKTRNGSSSVQDSRLGKNFFWREQSLRAKDSLVLQNTPFFLKKDSNKKEINSFSSESVFNPNSSKPQSRTEVFPSHLVTSQSPSRVNRKGKIKVMSQKQLSKNLRSGTGRAEKLNISKNEESKNNTSKLLLFFQAVGNVKASVETRKVRVGGVAYQVPSIIHKLRQEGIAMRWLINCASIKKESTSLPLSNCLSQEFLDSIKKESQSCQKRDQTHNIAVTNRANVRYRWW